MGLRDQALLAFELPAAPQQVDELPAPAPGADVCRVHTPAGRFLLLCSEGALALAFEATLFDLLAEARFQAPRPKRTRSGSMIARLKKNGLTAAASCYAWPPGEQVSAALATVPQLLEVGRLLARLHQLAETHPASVADARSSSLLTKVAAGPERNILAPVLEAALSALPSGAVHGGLLPQRVLFIGDRCSAILPSGLACSSPLVLDLAEAAVGWALLGPRAGASLRALVSGYQALRRLLPEERGALFAALRHAAAREGARRVAMGWPEPLEALRALDALGEEDCTRAAGG